VLLRRNSPTAAPGRATKARNTPRGTGHRRPEAPQVHGDQHPRSAQASIGRAPRWVRHPAGCRGFGEPPGGGAHAARDSPVLRQRLVQAISHKAYAVAVPRWAASAAMRSTSRRRCSAHAVHVAPPRGRRAVPHSSPDPAARHAGRHLAQRLVREAIGRLCASQWRGRLSSSGRITSTMGEAHPQGVDTVVDQRLPDGPMSSSQPAAGRRGWDIRRRGCRVSMVVNRQPPANGWTHRFQFVAGVAGFLGIISSRIAR
jgi:hypothetical protein